MTVTRAEHVALSGMATLVAGVTLPYLTDLAGFGIWPLVNAVAATLVGCAIAVGLRHLIAPGRRDVWLLPVVVLSAAAYLLWIAWPSLLPPGGGPDLTHHLMLIEYVERQSSLVHHPEAHGLLGEMADYPPGLHLLAVLAATLTRSSGFFAVYPVLVVAVALKAGIFVLILLRVLEHHPQRAILALCGVALLVYAPAYTLHSFTHDSFLAQVLSELFAIAMWWALVAWWQGPSRGAALALGVAGAAVFLTWPMWIGPPVLAFVVTIMLRHDVAIAARGRQLVLGLGPIVVVAALHTFGRTAALQILGTSGAVVTPSPALLGWWLPALAAAGLAMAVRDQRHHPLGIFAAAIALQAGALWFIATRRGADTPYMAIKMTYLAIYPMIAAAVLCVSRFAGRRSIAWLVLALIAVASARGTPSDSLESRIVSRDLWHAGRWVRARFAPRCVDYLVANAGTAYWLHLAVLGNPRASERSTNNDTFDTQRAFERWLTDSGPPYAIANLDVIPVEIRARTRVLHLEGTAAILERVTATPVAAGETCAVSRPTVAP